MDNIECNEVQPVVRKAKKKQAKGELDRLKQAEKKKRRLEKALATSAAIISELEKKKQKKKEEQQRLDEEGAAVAEAVALRVLLGEDSDESCKILLNKEEGFNSWDYTGSIDLFVGEQRAWLPPQDFSRHSNERIGWISDNRMENNNWSFSYGSFGRDFRAPYLNDGGWRSAEFSADLIAAQAVSSLQIAEDGQVDTLIFNGMLGS